jgi:predicted nuclease with TOPRIM domain
MACFLPEFASRKCRSLKLGRMSMPDTCLEDIAVDVADEHHIITTALLSAQKKYEVAVARCGRLRNALRKREDDLKGALDDGFANLQELRETVLQSQKLATAAIRGRKRMKGQLDRVKQESAELKEKLGAKEAKLEQLKHLTCEILFRKR